MNRYFTGSYRSRLRSISTHDPKMMSWRFCFPAGSGGKEAVQDPGVERTQEPAKMGRDPPVEVSRLSFLKNCPN